MFIAMNRFKVIKGSEAAFENVWLSRDGHLEKVAGLRRVSLLKGVQPTGALAPATTLFKKCVGGPQVDHRARPRQLAGEPLK